MNILEHLTRLRTEVDGAVVVVLSDLSTGIVLCSSAVIKQSQERLDVVAKTGKRLFNNEDLKNLWAGPDEIDEIIAINATNAQIFMRSRDDNGEVLSCVCTLDTDLAVYLEKARSVLCKFSAPT